MRIGLGVFIFGWLCSISQLFAQVKRLPSKHLSQEYVIKNFTVEDGLPSNSVLDIGFDNSSNIWFTTVDGLSIAEGTSIKSFSSHNSSIVGNHSYYTMAVTNDGGILFPNAKDGLIYYKDSNFSVSDIKNELSSNFGKFVSVTGDSVWLSLFNSGLILIVDNEIRKKYSTDNGLVSNQIWSTYIDKSGHIWVTTNEGLSIIKNDSVINYTKDSGLLDNTTRDVIEAEDGEVWLATSEGINVFRGTKLTSTFYQFDGQLRSIESLEYDPVKGEMWIGNFADGIYRFNIKNNSIIQFTEEEGLPDNQIYSINIDEEGDVWIATNEGAINLKTRKVKPVSEDINAKVPVLGVSKDSQDIIYAGGRTSLFKINEKKDKFILNLVDSLGGISNINENREGIIIVGTTTTGVGILNENDSWRVIDFSTDSVSNFVQDISLIDDESWVVVQDGIYVLDQNFKVTEKLSIPGVFFINSEQYQKNKMLIGTYQDGIKMVSRDSGVLTISDYLDTGVPVVAIKTDKRGSLFFTDNLGSIYRYTENELFEYDFKTKSLTNSLNSIYIDSEENMWIMSSQGLFKTRVDDFYHPEYVESQSVPFLFFNKEDGLDSYSNPANDNQIVETETGKLIIATEGGAYYLSSDLRKKEITFKKPKLSSVLIDGKQVNYEEAIRVKNDNNSLVLTFSMPKNLSKSKSIFSYRVRSGNDSLIFLLDRNEIILDFLESGTHTFEVFGTNEMGTWSEEPLIVEVIKEYPFYRKWWFMTLGFLGFIAIGAGGVQIRSNLKLQRLNRELETQRKIQAERERISRELHDNVGSQITNLITGIEVSNLHVKKNQQDKALSLLGNLDSDARSAMTDLRETIWLLDKEKVEFGVFTEHLRGYLRRQERYLDGLKVSLDSSVNNDSVLDPGQSLNLTRIIQEALNNTRKYAKATTFSVLCTQDENVIQVRIKDDGKGMDVDDEIGKGNGLNNMAHRAKEMEGQFEINSKKGNGTEIRLSFGVKIP